MTADEERIDVALRKQHRSHASQDEALTRFRMAQRFTNMRTAQLERVADLLVGEGVR
ncbi:hypothetical protein [Dyella psychrodurans]|uniref:hypothetical protein n=1 Tax=Dyella psychrodurans TaxID=1927960 RepID=UPI00131469F6|nr:hypothetical protein [Dyella psychrodurans]